MQWFFAHINEIWFVTTSIGVYYFSGSAFWWLALFTFPYACLFGFLSGGLTFALWLLVFFLFPVSNFLTGEKRRRPD